MKKLFIVLIILVLSTISGFGFATGLYITPKFSFEAESTPLITNMFLLNLGGGVAVGYDFFKITRRVPIRVDLEYIGRAQLGTNQAPTSIHTFAVNVYYDINLFKLKRSKIKTTTLDSLYNEDPIMSIYLMASFAGRLTSIPAKITEPNLAYDKDYMTSYGTNYTSLTFLAGAGIGLAFNVNSFVTVDAMYRIMFGPSINLLHEALLGVRFTMPRNKITFAE